jgi:hypothetical protein
LQKRESDMYDVEVTIEAEFSGPPMAAGPTSGH